MKDSLLDLCSRETISALFAHHGLPRVDSVVPITRGATNPAAVVNGNCVLRLNSRSPHDPKFRREAAALTLLSGTAVPVPRVIMVDDSSVIAPFPCIVTSLMPGTPLDQMWGELHDNARSSLASQAGRILADIHTLPVHEAPPDLERRDSIEWPSTVANFIETRLRSAREANSIPLDLLDRIQESFATSAILFSLNSPLALLHGDYQTSNMTSDGSKVTGLFDFEWAHFGDPEYDFRVFDNLERKSPGVWEPFFEGYTSVRTLSDQFHKKVLLYQLVWRTGITTLALRHWGPAAHSDCLERIIALLDAIERGATGPLLYST